MSHNYWYKTTSLNNYKNNYDHIVSTDVSLERNAFHLVFIHKQKDIKGDPIWIIKNNYDQNVSTNVSLERNAVKPNGKENCDYSTNKM